MRGTIEQQVRDEHIREARIALRNGSETSLRDVTVRADSVIGFADDGRERRAIPFAEVAMIERREVSILRTGAVMVATVAIGYVAFVAAAFASLGPNWTAVPTPAPGSR
jgi:hypothetical protein